MSVIGIVLSAYAADITACLDWFELLYLYSETTETVALPQQGSDILRLVGDIILFEVSAWFCTFL